MKKNELELRLKEIDENIVINDLSKYDVNDVCEVAYNYNGRSINICACPANEIKEEVDPDYKDEFGRRHRTLGEVISLAENFINRWNNEEGFKELMTCDDKDL